MESTRTGLTNSIAVSGHRGWRFMRPVLPQLRINLSEVVTACLAAEPLCCPNRAIGETLTGECVMPDLNHIIAQLGGDGVRAYSITLTMGNDLDLKRRIGFQHRLLDAQRCSRGRVFLAGVMDFGVADLIHTRER